ncbi:MAG TPA: tRNA lysidine(34) synthetase TilS [Myxococcota bacterium]|nr:tRNA lysidine(34) synthetase TilS [Myxococcota bacterium]
MARRRARGDSDEVLAALRSSCAALALRGERVLVAISGGVDSCVLLDALAQLAPELGFTLAAGHVNHGLRGAESDADEACAADLAKHLGVAFAARRVAPRALRQGGPSRTRPTLQEAARKLRHPALRELARELGCSRIATAHTLDDQAETVLMRLFRGASPAGLGGIAERSQDGVVVRPLLAASRAAIERRASERGLVWREDASNRDPHYARGKLRIGNVAALARELNPEWLRAVGQLAEAQRKESEWIDEQVEREAQRWLRAESGALSISRAGFAALPDALARRLLRLAIRSQGGARDVSRAQLERSAAFVRSARPGAQLSLPRGLVWRAQRDVCRLERVSENGSAPRSRE